MKIGHFEINTQKETIHVKRQETARRRSRETLIHLTDSFKRRYKKDKS